MIKQITLVIAAILLISGTTTANEAPARQPMMGAKMDCEQPPMLAHMKKRLSLNADQESALFDAMRQHCETVKTSAQKMHDTMKHVLSAEQQAQLEKMHSERGARGEREHGEHHRDHDGGEGKK